MWTHALCRPTLTKPHAETALQTATTALTLQLAYNACPTFSSTRAHAFCSVLLTSSRTQPTAFHAQKFAPQTVSTALWITCVSSVLHNTSFCKIYATANAPQGIVHQGVTHRHVKCSFHLRRPKAFLSHLLYVL